MQKENRRVFPVIFLQVFFQKLLQYTGSALQANTTVPAKTISRTAKSFRTQAGDHRLPRSHPVPHCGAHC